MAFCSSACFNADLAIFGNFSMLARRNSIVSFRCLLKVFSSSSLMALCTTFFRYSRFPDCLKLAMVIPIHKKESKLEVSNYRPISLLSNINKLLEKIIHERTYSFLEKFGCLYKHQYGFRKSHSTNHALIEITEKIRIYIDIDIYTLTGLM